MAQYIPKAAVVAEIESRIKERDNQMKSGCWVSSAYIYEDLLDFLDTLEVMKIGVDLGDPKGDKSAKCIIDTKTIEVKEVDLKKRI